MALGDARSDGPDADLGHELDVDASLGVRVLEVEDELGQVLDRIDVVVRRRRDQADTGRGMTGLGDPGVHLVARQLATLAGLCALGHLDLQVVAVDEVLARHAEAAGRHLLDGRTAEVAVGVGLEPVGVLATFAGVGLPSHAVHGDGESFVGFCRDRPV